MDNYLRGQQADPVRLCQRLGAALWWSGMGAWGAADHLSQPASASGLPAASWLALVPEETSCS